jgi:hypothetical protein
MSNGNSRSSWGLSIAATVSMALLHSPVAQLMGMDVASSDSRSVDQVEDSGKSRCGGEAEASTIEVVVALSRPPVSHWTQDVGVKAASLSEALRPSGPSCHLD